MKNHISNMELKYSEVAIALEDYTFGSYVKCSIPTMMAFLSKSSIDTTTVTNSTKNIKNAVIDGMGIGTCTTCNYIELFIDSRFCTDNTNTGSKGDKYAVIFVGGNMNNPVIIERL